jgi:hypothetical protein
MKSTRFEDRWWHLGGSRIGADTRGRVFKLKNFLPIPIRPPLAQS